MSLRHSFINSSVPCIASPNSSKRYRPCRHTQHPAITRTPEASQVLVDQATIHPDDAIAIRFNNGATH